MARPRNHKAHINAAITQLISALTGLAQDAARRLGGGKAVKAGRAPAPKKARKRRPMSPKTRLLRKQQGQFMGLVRALTKSKREAIKKLRREKGYKAAIAAARKSNR